MTPADAAKAWFRQISWLAPNVDGVMLRSVAEALADGEPGELQALAAELRAVADVVAEEACADTEVST